MGVQLLTRRQFTKASLAGLTGAALCGGSLPAVRSAHAAGTAWAESDGGDVRLIADAPQADGTIRAALDIRLKPGWKTYWRDPGASGIPPSLSIDGSVNIASAQLQFPAPLVVRDAQSVWAGYKEPVRFPLTLTQDNPADASVLSAKVFLGICERVCIPFQASFTLPIPQSADPRNADQIADAFKTLPGQPAADFRILQAERSRSADRVVEVVVELPEFRPAGVEPHVFLACTDCPISFEPGRLLGMDGRLARFAVSPAYAPKEANLSGSQVVVVATLGQRSIETMIEIG